jgi:hypothetical protein
MRFVRLLALALIVTSLSGWAPDYFQKRDWSESQLLTRAAPSPTGDATKGFDLRRVISFVVLIRPGEMVGGVCTPSETATFSGTGTVDLYFRDTTLGRWYYGDPDSFLDLSVTDCTGKTSCSKTFNVLTPRGRALPAANAITISAGNCVFVNVLASVSGKSSTQ